MNNIEILENKLKLNEKTKFDWFGEKEFEAIENLIQENKELKEDLDYISKEKWKADEAILFLTERIEEYQKQLDLDYVEENYIAKSKLKEKIEELDKWKNKIKELLEHYKNTGYDELEEVLQELLEEGE